MSTIWLQSEPAANNKQTTTFSRAECLHCCCPRSIFLRCSTPTVLHTQPPLTMAHLSQPFSESIEPGEIVRLLCDRADPS